MKYNYDYFISYAHADNASEDGESGFVDKFVKKLRKSKDHLDMFGEEVSVFFDRSTIQNMVQWDNKIRAGLASSRFLIVLLSPSYFKSEYCAKEFDWWMQHEMHRCTLGEGTAPMLIVDVASLQDPNAETIPEIPEELQLRYPNWLKQIREIQADLNFDMHDLLLSKIDETLNALRDGVKDKVRHQDMADGLPHGTGYPVYNKKFVGRRENLLSLRRNFTEETGKSASVLTGLGGFGKTELALTYGHAFGWDYQLGRFFKPCDNCNTIYEALLTCGILEMYGLKPEGSNEDQLKTLYEHLKEKQQEIIVQNVENGILRTEGAHILLILDNVNNLDLISQLIELDLPEYFHVIITTRENTSAYTDIFMESVERLSEDESFELLNNLRLFDNPAEAEAARKIAKLLAGFTLIVELTGAYLARNSKNPLVTYQSQYERLVANPDHVELFRKMAKKIGDLTRHAAETVSAVMESTLSAISENTRKALNFASLMSPDAVALSWLPELCELNEDEGEEVINELTGYSLLTPLEGEPNIARIHRLVAKTVKKEIPEEVQKKIVNRIRGKCNELLHKDMTFWCTPDNSWNITPVSEFCLQLADQWTVETSEEEIDWNLTWMINTSGSTLFILGKMIETRKVYLQCYEIDEERVKTFPSCIDTQQRLSKSCFGLSTLEQTAGNVADAREWSEKAIEIDQRLLDQMPNNVDILRSLGSSYKMRGNLEQIAGNLADAREWSEKAIEIDQRLADLMPNDINTLQKLSFSYLLLGNLEIVAGNTVTAREWFEKLLEISKRLADMMPDNVDTLLNLSVSYERLGGIEKIVGNAAAARERYKKAMEINKRLADQMPDNIHLQMLLSVLYNSLGDLEKAAGNTAAAREWFEKAIEISKMPTNLLQDNYNVQQVLSLSYNSLGDIEQAAGNAAAAREWYEKAMENRKRLAENDPDNFNVQLLLNTSYDTLGDLEKAAGNAAVAREWYEKALENRKRLAEQMPDNIQAQRDLSVSYNRLGDLEKDAGNAAAAREWYEKALENRKRLADLAPDNILAHMVLCNSYSKLGDLEKDAGNAAAAREWYEKALENLKRLAENNPDNVQVQRELSCSYYNLGNLEDEAGNAKAMKTWFMKAFEICQKLADAKPEDFMAQENLADIIERLGSAEKADGQTAKAREYYDKALGIYQKWAKEILENLAALKDLSVLYHELGDLEFTTGNIKAALEWFEKALEIRQRLVDKSPDNVEYQKDLAKTQEKIAQAKKQSWYVKLIKLLFNLFRRG